MNTPLSSYKFKLYTILSISTLLLIVILFTSLHLLFTQELEQQYREELEAVLRQKERIVYGFFGRYSRKLKVISSGRAWMKYQKSSTDRSSISDIQERLHIVLEGSKYAREIVYIDNRGYEQIRIKKVINSQKIKVSFLSELRNESTKYYTNEVLKLKVGEIWSSSKDLIRYSMSPNIEPVIRMAIRLRDGFIMIGIDPKELFKSIKRTSGYSVFLIRGDGKLLFNNRLNNGSGGLSINKTTPKDLFGENTDKIMTQKQFYSHLIASKSFMVRNNRMILAVTLDSKIYSKRFEYFYSFFTLACLLALFFPIVATYYFIRPLIQSKDRELLKQSHEYLAIINQHIMIASIDTKGMITYINDAFINISGYSSDELLGNSHLIMIHNDTPKELLDNIVSTVKSGTTWHGNIKNIKKDESYFWAEVSVNPNYSHTGDIVSFTSIGINITDKMALEKLTQEQQETITVKTALANSQRDKAIASERAKSDFLANMSHEIRTPLNAILGFVEILSSEVKDKKLLSYIKTIDSSSQGLLQVIEDILDFSKIESGKLNIDKIKFRTEKSFKSIVELFTIKADEKGIDMTLKFDNSIPPVICTDPLRIKQIISNLLSNAIKFTPSGKRIEIIVYYAQEQLQVYVKDEGKGIARDKLVHIFNSFSQEDTSTTRRYGGTGLGLTISRKLVELLGGKLHVTSKLGVGSEFYFYVPAKAYDSLPEDKKRKEHESGFDKSATILLVEDNRSNQIFMKIIFKKIGVQYDIANDGVEAVEMYKSREYGLILMDENMPNMNGIEATKKILEIEKETNQKHTPIIALTANALKGDRERFISAGMDDYTTKPIKQDKILDILERFLPLDDGEE